MKSPPKKDLINTPTKPISALSTYYLKLFNSLGPQNWWPGDSPLEITVGAILTQNTSWSNVEKAIIQLKEHHLLPTNDPSSSSAPYIFKLQNIEQDKLAQIIKASGYFNIKAKRLKNFIHFVWKNYTHLENMLPMPLEDLRQQLLSINGIGGETADSILLYGFNKPSFVIDAYTRRIFSRHKIFTENSSYEELRTTFMNSITNDTQLYNEYHALIVHVGKHYCRPKNPRCDTCPLKDYL